MLQFENVFYNYPDNPVLKDVSFAIKQGEFVFLIGKSGCGKSTLLQMIYMQIKPAAGTVHLAEYDSSTISKREIPYLRRKIGVVFQDFKPLKDRNVYDNVAFVLEVTGAKRRNIKQKVNDALNSVGLMHKRNYKPDQLSGGEQQRVAIARAIVNDPALILADEPTGNLDPETSDEIMQLIKKIHNRGTAVLYATHNYELLKKYNERILKLDSGNIKEITANALG